MSFPLEMRIFQKEKINVKSPQEKVRTLPNKKSTNLMGMYISYQLCFFNKDNEYIFKAKKICVVGEHLSFELYIYCLFHAKLMIVLNCG